MTVTDNWILMEDWFAAKAAQCLRYAKRKYRHLSLSAFWHCQRVVGCKNSPVFEFQSRYIEHHFEARATLPPILDVCVAAFLFCLFSKINCPNTEKSQQLNIREEIFKIIGFFALLAGYSLRDKKFLEKFSQKSNILPFLTAYSLRGYFRIPDNLSSLCPNKWEGGMQTAACT